MSSFSWILNFCFRGTTNNNNNTTTNKHFPLFSSLSLSLSSPSKTNQQLRFQLMHVVNSLVQQLQIPPSAYPELEP